MLSKGCEYAIRAMILIMTYSMKEERVGVKAIVGESGLPGYFTANLLKDLTKKGILESSKGPNGGFFIPNSGRSMTLMDIITAVDGNGFFVNCGLGLPACSDITPCPVHEQFAKTRDEFRHMCSTSLIKDLAVKLTKGEAFIGKTT